VLLRLLCETFPGDVTSWIEVLYVRPAQVMATVAFPALMRTNTEPLKYELDTFGLQETLSSKEGVETREHLIEQGGSIAKAT
jgi:hypothetical protein